MLKSTKVLLAGIAIISFLSFANSANTSAISRPANASERAAKAWAAYDTKNGSCAGPYGALWITENNNSNPFNEGGSINVSSEQKEVNVRLRGSLYSCGVGWNQTGYGTNIRKGDGANAERLVDLLPFNQKGKGKIVERGYISTKSGTWTAESATINNYLTMKVNIADVAAPGTNQSIKVSIYRCYNSAKANRTYENSGCKSEDYTLNIKRASKPSWQAEGRSYVKKSVTNTASSQADNNWGTASRTISAKVGDYLYFKHTIGTKSKGSVVGTKLNWAVKGNSNYFGDNKGSDFQSSGAPRNQGQATQAANIFLQASPSGSKNPGKNSLTTYQVKAKDAGKKICQKIEFNPNNGNSSAINNAFQGNNGNTAYTNWSCAFVSFDYELTPVVPLDPSCTSSCDKEVESGTPDVSVPPAIIYPPTAPIKDTAWKFTSFVVRPNQTIPGASDPNKNGFISSENDPCNSSLYNQVTRVYQSNEESSAKKLKRCTVEQSGTISAGDFTGTGNLGVQLNDAISKFSVPEEAEVGTKYCFALSISPYKMSGNWNESEQNAFKYWSHGKPGCIVVVKKPKTQVLGGGLSAAEGLYGLTSTRANRLYGSWIEFEAISVAGINKNVATNGVFGSPDSTIGFSGSNSSTSQQSVQNRLTFANTNSNGNIGASGGAIYGKYASNLPNDFAERVKAKYANVQATSTNSSISGDLAGDKVYKPNGEVNVGQVNVTAGTTIVVYAPDRTVNINADIKYAAGSYSPNELPQMIIIAKKIAIAGEVGRIDSWLLSQDEINTCAKEGGRNVILGALSNNSCSNQLTVNGPVTVSSGGESLKLWRTAGSIGSGDGIGLPAEVFNLRPETYLWANAKSALSGKIITTHTKELPPRF